MAGSENPGAQHPWGLPLAEMHLGLQKGPEILECQRWKGARSKPGDGGMHTT